LRHGVLGGRAELGQLHGSLDAGVRVVLLLEIVDELGDLLSPVRFLGAGRGGGGPKADGREEGKEAALQGELILWGCDATKIEKS